MVISSNPLSQSLRGLRPAGVNLRLDPQSGPIQVGGDYQPTTAEPAAPTPVTPPWTNYQAIAGFLAGAYFILKALR